MFTGIVEEIGKLRRVAGRGHSLVLTIDARKVLEDVHIGDSIAVNGVCLTVVAFDATSVSMDVMPETYRQTNLASLRTGSPVNLERAMSARGRFGGHIVQGHVDCTGTITARAAEENAVVFTVEPIDKGALLFIIPRGSITIDGISLTVIQVTDDDFSVSIIPHTLQETVLQHKHPGDTVNLETDLLGKYIYRFMQANQEKKTGRLTSEFLAEHGFI